MDGDTIHSVGDRPACLCSSGERVQFGTHWLPGGCGTSRWAKVHTVLASVKLVLFSLPPILPLPHFHAFLFFLINLFILLYNIVLVLPHIDLNPPWVTCVSHPEPPPSPSHPSGSSQCTSPGHPVARIEPGLAIRFTYDNLHVSMPFSQIIPPLPSPTESKDYSIHLCLFCPLSYRVIITIFLHSIYVH